MRLGSHPVSGAIEVRYIGPNNELKYVVSLPVTAKRSDSTWAAQAIWGNDQPGTFQRGNWQIEVWTEGAKISSRNFQVF